MSRSKQGPGEASSLEQALGYRFRDPALLETALTHRSHSHENRHATPANYERLELLGDAFLGFAVADWLYRDDPDAPEGVLSRRRQSVVRASALAATAATLGLGGAVRLGRGEERTGGRRKSSLLADTFEAVLGAIYLDGGVRPARAFVRRHLGALLEKTRLAVEPGDDFKTRLQEQVQARLQRTPRYRIVTTTGPAHALTFEAEVLVGERILGRGHGTNRKRAEQAAAREAMGRLKELENPDR